MTQEKTECMNNPLRNKLNFYSKAFHKQMNRHLQDQMVSLENVIKYLENIISILHIFFQKIKEERTLSFQLILWGQRKPNTKTWQKPLEKRKIQTNIVYEHRFLKNPPPNISKSNTALYKGVNGVYSRNTMLVQRSNINQYNWPYQQTKKDFLNICGKIIWPTPNYDEN